MSTELVKIEKGIVTLQADLEGIKRAVTDFNKVKQALIQEGKHVITISGNQYIKKSGWRTVALGFNISDEIIGVEEKMVDGETIVSYTVKATAPNGRYATGVGACSTGEKRWHRKDKSKPMSEENRILNTRYYHDTITHAHTRAKNRAISELVGLGEVTAEEVENGEPSRHTTSENVEFCKCETGPKTMMDGKCKECGLYSKVWWEKSK